MKLIYDFMSVSVFVNNKNHSLGSAINLFSLLKELKIDSSNGIAIAVNEIVIPKSEWEKYKLKNNDKIILIKAAAGG